jgi:gluconolactonase
LKKHFLLLPLLLAAVFATGELPADTQVKPTKVVEVPGYSEGVVFDRAGNAYISDTINGAIHRVTPDGRESVWARTGAPNGHKVEGSGTHLVCDGKERAVLRLDRDGKLLGKASSEYDGRPLRSPNDLTLDPKSGGFYFTDPGGSSVENPIGTVHYVDARGKTHLVAEGLAFPNGIVLRPDGRLLVAESQHNRVLIYEVLAPGKVGPMKVFATLPTKEGEQIDNQPDGMCLDADLNLYVAHYGMRQVQVLSKEGKLLRRYAGGNLTTSNVAFGGPRMDQLYVTGALGEERTTKGGLFRLDLKGVKGLKILPKR